MTIRDFERRAAINARRVAYCDKYIHAAKDAASAQPEPSIPILWIEKHVDWLKSMDNGYANLIAMNISTMVKKWKKEQEDNDDLQ